MNILQVGIAAFLVIETLNVLMLYFAPGMKKGNALGVFKAWNRALLDDSMKQFALYMASWVAGAKIIFILVGLVVIIWGNMETQLATAAAMAISISTFFWRLYPATKMMDQQGELEPKGYSKTLALMIAALIIGFFIIFVIGLVQYLGRS